MKKALAIVMVLTALLSLASCGESAPADPNSGVYAAVSAELMGIAVNVDEVFEDGFSVELQDGGKAVFHYDGKDYRLKWKLDGASFTASGGGVELKGTLERGTMILEDVLDSGINIKLVCAALIGESGEKAEASAGLAERETAAPEPSAAAEPEAPRADTEAQTVAHQDKSWWDGLWYGWRVYMTAEGVYADWEGRYYDCVGTINTYEDLGVIVLWDYDALPETCFVTVNGHFETDPFGNERFVSDGGYGAEDCAGVDDWIITPADSPVSSLDHMIAIYGFYSDPNNSANWYEYYIFLRPWGMDWEDVREADPEDLPYADMMPYDYDWYLNMLAEGRTPLTELEDEDGVG